jgi:biotin synthase
MNGMTAGSGSGGPDLRAADVASLPSQWATKALSGEALSREEAVAILNFPDEKILALLHGAYEVRYAHFGKRVKLNFLANIQSGICAEDCGYCSQSRESDVPVEKYKLLDPDEVLQAAESAVANKAARLCLVASMRGPNARELSRITEAVRAVKSKYPQLEVCTSLGLLQSGQAESLKDAGVDAYNHNLNTSERHYGEICSTHTFTDRLDTVREARMGGMHSCSGALFGMGENEADILEVAYRLREMQVESIPINFLIPFEGTPVGDRDELSPTRCLKILCLFRFLCPASELRVAGGRELHLRSLQPMGLFAATSIFVGDYLTTQGQAAQMDLAMVRDLGFEIVGEQPDLRPSGSKASEVNLKSPASVAATKGAKVAPVAVAAALA